MVRIKEIPAPAVRRLSLYLRHVELLSGRGERTVSSRQLGEALGLTGAQVRKDLSHLGSLGHPGIGYRVDELIVRVRRILGTDTSRNVLLVGAGNLGRALVSHRGFAKKGFHVVAVFDDDERVVGSTLDGAAHLVVRPMIELADTVRKKNIRMAILAVPGESAQSVAEQLWEVGVGGILNFAPVTLRHVDCAIAAVDLAVHLEQLSFRLGNSRVG